MERCDEKNKIYTRQWSIAKYTRAAANIFITKKEEVRDGKPYCPSQPCIFTAYHPGVRTTKIHRCYSIKLFQNWADFHVALKHLGAYAPSWPVWHCLGAELHADRSRRHSLIATWAFVRTSWGSQVFIQSPSIPPTFHQKFDVAVLAVPPLLNGLYAPFSIFRYGCHALLLQTHKGIGQ